MKLFDRTLRALVAGFYCLLVGIVPALPQAALLPNAKQQFLDSNGNPLASGKVYMYVPNTVVPKTTWSDSGETTPNTNPVVLDSGGFGVIYGQGSYQQKVTTSTGSQLWNAQTTAWNSAAPSGATGTDTAPVGSILQWSGFTIPTNWAWANGQAVSRTTYSDLLTAITISNTTVTCTSGSSTLAGWSDTSQIAVGSSVEGSCLPVSTTVVSITNSSTIVVSNNATSTAVVTATVYPWGNGDGTSTFNIPDLRGRVTAGADAMGGTAANRLQATTTITTASGALTASVASATNLYAGMTVVSTNVPAGTTVTALTGTTVALSQAASGAGSATAAVFRAFTGANAPAASGGSTNHTVTISEMPSHSHNPNTIGGDPIMKFIAGSGGFSGGGAGSGATQATITVTNTTLGGGEPHSIVQPTITSNFIVKIKANTTGAGGVVSLGGMVGDIVCDATFLCSAQGSPAVNTIGLATQLTGTVLANVGSATAQPTATTFTSWLDFVCGGTQGSVVYRGGSTWACLIPGTSGQFFKTLGAGANPAWSALPVATSLIPGIVQGDGSTITLAAGIISCTTMTAAQFGCGRPDNATMSVTAGVFNCVTMTTSQIGCAKPDGTTIIIAGGAITAVGAATTSVAVGVTTVASGTNGSLLYDNAGVLGNATLSSLMDTAFSSTRGSVLYRGAAGWAALAPGTSGNVLTSGGAGADPAWGAGGISSLNGLTGAVSIAVGKGLTVSAASTTVTIGTPVFAMYGYSNMGGI